MKDMEEQNITLLQTSQSARLTLEDVLLLMVIKSQKGDFSKLNINEFLNKEELK